MATEVGHPLNGEPFRLRPLYRKEAVMPVKVVKRSGYKPWKIVEIATGKVVGSAMNKRDADISAWKRNEAHKKGGKK